ncbi:MAG: flagellar brake protein [Nitrosomonas sp.]|uniref:flagellar brake protein n=1 Tax=Nitrosomonas sp. TaxID=42353 RepID=UPI002733DE58|nr:flagellar brake protein [Nitrosomonas sp.]MDP3282388.1 flagellar brake protein [Nitrosomonas sp.]
MNLIPIQTTDLTIGQPLPWDLFDQAHQPIQKRGYIFKTEDELKQLEGSSIFRMQKPEPDQIESSGDKFRFDDMHLKVGHKLQLKLSSRSKGPVEIKYTSYVTSLIGYVQDSTVITAMPATDQLIGEPFVEGDQVQVSLFSGNSVFNFIVFVDKVIKVPFKYLHLSFPKEIQGQNIRKSRRIRCSLPGSVVEKHIPLSLIDLSVCGAGVSSSLPLGPLGTIITLAFTITILDKEIPVTVKSAIRSAKPINKNGHKTISTGVEFIDIKSEHMHTIRHLIYQEIVEHPENVI